VNDQDLSQLIDGAFDFLCERRVSELVDVERVMKAVDAAAQPAPMASMISRLVAPARARIFQRLADSDRLLGVWLPEPVKDALAQLLGMPVRIPKPWIDKAVTDERVREQVRQTMQEALSGAVQKGFSVTPGGRGLKGMIGLAGAAGRGLFGGIGEEIQRQIEDRLKDLVDSGVSILQQRVATRLMSDETAQQLGKRRRRAFLDLMKTPEKEAAKNLTRAPHEALDAMAPAVVAHNLGRAEFRQALTEEIAAAVAELSKQPIGELLEELGVRTLMKEAARAHALPLLREFVASPHFSGANKNG
jgi:hypothetical protein